MRGQALRGAAVAADEVQVPGVDEDDVRARDIGEVCGLVGLNELVVHAWDLGRATGQPVNAEPEVIRALLPMLDQFSPPIDAPRGDGPFGPRFPVSSGAPLLDQLVGLAGRDPSWSPATALG